MAEKKASPGTEAQDRAMAEATAAARSTASTVMERLADRVGAHAGVDAVYGKPVEKNGRIVIPVAQSMWGSGAGFGDDSESGAGMGAGSGAMSRPVGYIELSDHEARFVPLKEPWQDARLILAIAIALWLASRALNRILRG